MGAEQNMHRARLTEEQEALLSRVEASYAERKAASYALSEAERRTAARLVDMGLLFYSMDRDHVASYKAHL